MGETTSSDEEDILDDPYELDEEDIYLENLNVYDDLTVDDYVVFIFYFLLTLQIKYDFQI